MLRLAARTALGVLIAAALAACDPAADPPMPAPRAHLDLNLNLDPVLAGSLDEAIAESIDAGATRDADPDEAEAITDERLASIATETSIYEQPRWGSRRVGYMRAGATVRRARIPAAAGAKCPEGWYRVEPRGYVCVGAMATLDLGHAVVLASTRRPRLDDLPYPYVLSRFPPPPLYARLPAYRDQLKFERDLAEHLVKVSGVAAGFPPLDPIPAWLADGRAAPSLGNRWHGADRVILDHAHPRSGFALLTTVDHAGRRFGVDTGLEVLPLDRTTPAPASTFSGIALGEVTLPVAFVKTRGAYRVIDDPQGIRPGARLDFREAVPVTDEARTIGGVDYLVAKDGTLIPAHQIVVIKPFRHLPAWSADEVKWIDVSIPKQTLVAYEGVTPVYATLVSTGTGGTGDPKETHATVQGAFRIYEKHTTVTMDGHETADSFDLRDVPFVQYFTESYALHAAYWHDDFGHLHSHGCVNLAPRDAAWLFRWTDPHVPEGWHAVMTKTGGTIVYVHD
ncbi:MAG: L,D-transpeptidase [Byssovorax sp.]